MEDFDLLSLDEFLTNCDGFVRETDLVDYIASNYSDSECEERLNEALDILDDRGYKLVDEGYRLF